MTYKAQADCNYKDGLEYFHSHDLGKAFGSLTTAVDLYNECLLQSSLDEIEKQAILQNIWNCEEYIDRTILQDASRTTAATSSHFPYQQQTQFEENEYIKRPDPDPMNIEVLNATLDCEGESSGFSQVIGNENVVQQLRSCVTGALFPELKSKSKSKPASAHSILLFGPTGSGKSFILRALMSELTTISGKQSLPKVTVWRINVEEILTKYGGKAATFINILFKKSHGQSPSLVCVEEVDNFKANLDAQNSFRQSIAELNGKGVVCVGTTTRPLHTDRLILKEFSRKIYVRLPKKDIRQAIIQTNLRKQNMIFDPATLKKIADSCDIYTISELKAVVTEVQRLSNSESPSNSFLASFRKKFRGKREGNNCTKKISKKLFLNALSLIQPRAREDDLRRMEEFAINFVYNRETIQNAETSGFETTQKVPVLVSVLLFFPLWML